MPERMVIWTVLLAMAVATTAAGQGLRPPTYANAGELLKDVDGLFKPMQQGADLWSRRGGFGPLTSDDLDYEPESSPPGSPQVPLGCAEDPGCGPCFTQAYRQLQTVRAKLENNRIVLAHYLRYMKRLDETATALGGLHGMLGVGSLKYKAEWDEMKRGIERQYDERYGALMAELLAALRAIEACEAEHYGQAGWYERYGFMYYEFMAARYQRAE